MPDLYCPKCHWTGEDAERHDFLFIDVCPIAKRHREHSKIIFPSIREGTDNHTPNFQKGWNASSSSNLSFTIQPS